MGQLEKLLCRACGRMYPSYWASCSKCTKPRDFRLPLEADSVDE